MFEGKILVNSKELADHLGRLRANVLRDLPSWLEKVGVDNPEQYMEAEMRAVRRKVEWNLPVDVAKCIVYSLDLPAFFKQLRAEWLAQSPVSTPLVTHAPSPATLAPVPVPVAVQAPPPRPLQPSPTSEMTEEHLAELRKLKALPYKLKEAEELASDFWNAYVKCKKEDAQYYALSDRAEATMRTCRSSSPNVEALTIHQVTDCLSIVESIKEIVKEGSALKTEFHIREDNETLYKFLKNFLGYTPSGFNEALFKTRQTAPVPTPIQAPAPTQTQGFTQEQFRSTMFDRNSDLCYKVNDLFNFAHEVLGLYLTCKADNLAYYTTSDLGTTALNMCGMAFSNIDFIGYKHTQDALSIVESIKELGRKGTGLKKPLVLSEAQESLFTELKQKLRYEPVGFNEALFELRQPELCEEDDPAPVKQSGMESHPLFDGTFPVPHNLSEVDKMPYRSAFVSKAVELNDLEDLFDKCKRTYESVAKTAVRWAKPDAEGFVSDVNLFTTLDRRRWTKFKVESNDPELVTTEQKAQLEGHIKLLLNDIRSRLQWAKTNCKDGVQFEVSPTVEEAMPIYLDGKPREITFYADDIE